MKYLLGIDFGGGSSKATLINTDGDIVAENTQEYPTYYPNLGWCEQAPKDWEEAFSQNVKENIKGNEQNAGFNESGGKVNRRTYFVGRGMACSVGKQGQGNDRAYKECGTRGDGSCFRTTGVCKRID
jgi:hypothetical protein